MHTQDLAKLAEAAWDATKPDEDPPFAAVAMDHRGKLLTATRSIYETGTAGIQGLEEFEAYVLAAVNEYHRAEAEAQKKLNDDAAAALAAAPKPLELPAGDSLPEGFPGRAALEAAGFTTITAVRELADSGALETVDHIGAATATAIKDALEEV